jgi:integrase
MVKKASEPSGRLRLPSEAELVALFGAADRVNADCGLLFRVAAATGARRSELLNLKYKDITLDDNNKIVSILFRKTKTKKYRTAFLTGGFFAVFSKRLGERLSLSTAYHPSDSDARVSLLSERPHLRTRASESENVFKKIKVTQISRAIRQSGVADFHFHDFRHYFCSTLAIDGQNPSVIQSLSGHADLKNLARYSHLTPKHAVDALREMQSKIDMPGSLGAGYGV